MIKRITRTVIDDRVFIKVNGDVVGHHPLAIDNGLTFPDTVSFCTCKFKFIKMYYRINDYLEIYCPKCKRSVRQTIDDHSGHVFKRLLAKWQV